MRAAEKQALVRRLQAGKRRARKQRPKRLRAIEREMDALGREFRKLPEGHSRRTAIIRELRELGERRNREREP